MLRRPMSVLFSVLLVASATAATAAPVAAHGACIAASKSATFTYRDWSGYDVGEADSWTPAKMRVTASVCHDTMGNVWAANAHPTFTIPSDSEAYTNQTIRWGYRSGTHAVTGYIGGFWNCSGHLCVVDAEPWIKATESGGVLSWSVGSDYHRYRASINGVILYNTYDPITWYAVWG
jgi:hypothetical protein